MDSIESMIFNYLFEFTKDGRATRSDILSAICPYGYSTEEITEVLINMRKDDSISYCDGFYSV